jgi:nitroimidazol reductase NimA-like FMN-containing flavoprotein (pyridoxamine 5'-phosphate oxidase superfamily)
MVTVPVTERTRVKRGLKRAAYDQETIYDILDSAYICHIGGVVDGYPVVQPNIHWRMGDKLYIHGSIKNGLISAILAQKKVCITVSLFDGIVLARSAFNHSINYRSVMLFGEPTLVEDEVSKMEILDALLEKFKEGRSKEARSANKTELKATAVVEISIQEVSAKIRSGGPEDDAADMNHPVWAGVIPVETRFGTAIQALT